MLIPPENLADFGIVDWLVEDAVGQGEEVRQRMVSSSPLSSQLDGEIRVVAATGRDSSDYLDKLSRAYGDIVRDAEPRRFSERVRDLLGALENEEKPDAVLIDSRAGLHDLAALSIVGLASTALLFATDTAAGWQGYRTLFSFWRSRPEALDSLKDRLKMVYALFPETDQAQRARSFLEHSHAVFTETLYEEQGPDLSPDRFNFAERDTEAPHYPLTIKWNARFQEFDPLAPDGFGDEASIRASYGDFIDAVTVMLEGGRP